MNLELVEGDDQIAGFPEASEVFENMPQREDIYNERLAGFLTQLATNIVTKSKQAEFEFSCGIGEEYFGLTKDETKRFLTDVEKLVRSKGYNVTMKNMDETQSKLNHTLLVVDWKKNEATY